MYRQVVKAKPHPIILDILLILLLVAGVYVLALLTRYWDYLLGTGFIAFIPYALLIVVALFIIRWRVAEYVYLMDNKEIQFYRKIGKREKQVYIASFKQMADLLLPGSVSEYKKMRLTVRGKATAHCLIYSDLKKGVRAIYFHPDSHIEERIINRLSVRAEKQV